MATPDTHAAPAKATDRPRGLQYFPIVLFASAMGFSGTTIAAMRIEPLLGLPPAFSLLLLTLTSLLFIVQIFLLLYRVFAYPEEVRRDFDHPVRMNFFGAVSISFMLLAAAYLDVAPSVAAILWWIGAPLHLLITLAVLRKLIVQSRFEIVHYNPAWFIPIVGNLIAPIAGVAVAPPDVNWFFFSIGIVMSVVYIPMFFYRIYFHNPIPLKLLPTFFILMAPPAVGLVSYVKLTGQFDGFARVLYGFAFFIGLLLVVLFPMFYRVPFFLSWWAYTFPSAAITIATVLMYHETGVEAYRYLAYVQMIALLILLVDFSRRTLGLMARRELCVKED
ncbi:MAG: SLAC1 anion channel family protein [Hydrogenibacillus schlegelii]|uniref:SLAC1 anion channel family protein n=1 Tax=Hydrogenibacillus schlegelii TaxID=1484 RepID=A0A947CYP4_HYDSH|nr:SLAC1 anion channel family protein [Hydrogenibacillus schlegelii]MBT9283439.1 SLAC1 anion channel family protein [Hydrogenibacillus schlegelii]